jgi:DNA topoisomerase I
MLIIVESPAKAKNISRLLGSKYTVKASVGHIRRITDDKKTKDGRKLEINGIDIEKDFKPMFEVEAKKKDVVSELKKLAKANVGNILFATDPDREGEAISWHLAQVLGVKDMSTVRRLEFHEITKSAIEHALAEPRPLDEKLVSAQMARQVLDKIVGYKLSPVLWTVMNNRNLSAGRVQSPALVIIYQRELEIQAFKPEEFWQLWGDFDAEKNTFKSKTIKYKSEESEGLGEKLEGRLELKKITGSDIKEVFVSEKQNEEYTKTLSNDQKFNITSISKKLVKTYPRPPFTTSTLQQAASSRLGFAPRSTMSLAQKLYEGVMIDGQPTALITYMRTDSVNLFKESIDSARAFIGKNYPDYLPPAPKFYKSSSKNAQEAHEAIRPVNPGLEPMYLKNKLDSSLWRLYDLIWRQMVSSQMSEEVSELTSFELENSQKDQFTGSVSISVNPGWKAVMGNKTKEKKYPFKLVEGSTLYLNDSLSLQKFTEPPSRFSPASLIKKLESLGIGRPSTYASIISTLQDRKYVEDNPKTMIPSALGMKIAQLLLENFTEITGNQMTAEMEENLDEISRGEKNYLDVLKPFWEKLKKEVEEKTLALESEKTKYRTISDETIDSPTGTGKLILKVGRFGEYWQNPEKKEEMYPKNFRELFTAELEAEKLYGDKVKGLVSPVSKEPLVVRVSKASLNTYIATAKYVVGSAEKALNIPKLDELGWTQKTVDDMYKQKPSGKKGFKRFFKKKK